MAFVVFLFNIYFLAQLRLGFYYIRLILFETIFLYLLLCTKDNIQVYLSLYFSS